jgi:L-lactate dehydrogenase complex protein LldG
MSSRDVVLGRIGAALGRTQSSVPTTDDRPAAVTARLEAAGRRFTLPAVGADLVKSVVDNMSSVLMSVVRLPNADDCVAAIQQYLEAEGIDSSQPGTVSVAPALAGLDWPVGFQSGAATGSERVGITPCLLAVAETGSVVTASGALTPSTLNFLPETHIVIVYESQIVRHVDDVFPELRKMSSMPRAINFITGPSRTADIEQTLEIGAHGPRRMHIILIAGSPELTT